VRFGLSWNPGYGFDIGVYQGWARSAVQLGLAQSYIEQVGGNMLPDYPPLSITMLAGFGHVYQFIFGVFDMDAMSYRMFIKLPAIFADVIICGLLYMVIKKWKGRKAGITGAWIYALNPAAIYDSALWGQTDSIYSMLLLAALTAWIYEKRDVTAIFLALSILTKLQSIALFPLFAFIIFTSTDRRAFLRFCVVGILTTLVVLIPFAMGNVLEEVMNVYLGSIGAYSNVTIGAYNFWWSILADKGWRIQSSTSPFGLMSYTKWGITLFGMLYISILYIFRRHVQHPRNIEALMYCSALLSAAFFLFLTQMHERYLFPFVVFGVPLCFISKKVAAAYWGMVIAFTVNLMGIMPLTSIDKAAFREFDALDSFVAGTQMWMFIFLMIVAVERFAPRIKRALPAKPLL
jgi:Gpi18-like mannosyltransferase